MLQVGIPVMVLEREPAPREEGSAITFWPNAFRVLDTLRVAHFVRGDSLACAQVRLHHHVTITIQAHVIPLVPLGLHSDFSRP